MSYLFLLVLVVAWLLIGCLVYRLVRGTKGFSNKSLKVIALFWPVIVLLLAIGYGWDKWTTWRAKRGLPPT